jgi:hypothetical protein
MEFLGKATPALPQRKPILIGHMSQARHRLSQVSCPQVRLSETIWLWFALSESGMECAA